MPSDTAAIHRKLDDLSAEMSAITRRLQSLDEFKQDLSLIANDAFTSIVHFLGEVDDHFDSRDLLALIQKGLRNLRGISALLDQLQSMRDLLQDASPLLKEAFSQVVEKLDQLEKDGVLRNISIGADALTRMLAGLSAAEMENLANAMKIAGQASARLATKENLDWLERFSQAAAQPVDPKSRPASMLRILLKARHSAVRRPLQQMLDAAIQASRQEADKNKRRKS